MFKQTKVHPFLIVLSELFKLPSFRRISIGGSKDAANELLKCQAYAPVRTDHQ